MEETYQAVADPGGHDGSDEVDGVAVVGMSLRLPGASGLDTFWENLRDGVESIRTFSDEELLAGGVAPARLRDPSYVKARGAIEDVELFDATFFGFTPREAETMDPQHRLFLEEAWRALEHSGYDAASYDGAIGVFSGANLTGYLLHNLAPNDELVKRVGPLQIRIRNDKDFLATLVAYKLDLTGPAVNVQTACSSSLVGVSLACQSLLSYQCDMVLAGGVSVTVPNPSGYLYQEGVYAPDGRCRSFDAEARGTVLGDGVAVVVLKRLEDALADGDTIHAVIRGFAVNNDGSLKLDYTAPSVDGQAEVISMAHALGEIDPETITYVEAHGTGTPLGDPIEVAALTQAFRAGGAEGIGFCGIGSVKTNIGHLDAAAGTSSLIKTVLALGHREIPPSLHFERPNPQLGLETSPFYVVREHQPWKVPEGVPRRAGVSSFGVGGTNAHVVVEEAPTPSPSGPSRPWQLLTLSAKSDSALDSMAARLADHLAACSELPLADVAYTLARGRRGFAHRRSLVCRDTADAVALLCGATPRRLAQGEARLGTPRPVAFLFSGIGDHYVGMGRGLYDREPVFRESLDEAAAILEPLLGVDPRQILYPEGTAAADAAPGSGPDLRRWLGRDEPVRDANAERLDRTEFLHPVLFMVEHALARQWMAWGAQPEAMIGYSIGEYVAACLAGVFTLEGALRLVAERARIIERQPQGAMLAVSLPEDEVAALLGAGRFGDLSLAAVNGPAFCVVSGGGEDVDALAAELEGREVVHRRLKARHPFHSRRLETVLDDFRAAVRGLELAPPEIPFLSNVTGTWISPEEATDPEYWARHMCRPVRFGEGVTELLRGGERILLEVGPGQSLTSVALMSAEEPGRTLALSSLPHEADPQDAQAFLLHALGRLWNAGAALDWAAFYDGEARRRVPLPTYPFERRRYWVEPVERSAAAPAVSLEKKDDPADWLYLPAWRQARAAAGEVAEGPWLLFSEGELGDALAARLAEAGREVVLARAGDAFAATAPGRYLLDPRRPEDYTALLAALAEEDRLPRHLVHLWSVPASSGDEALDRGFFSLLFLAQAWGDVAGKGRELTWTVVSTGALSATGDEALEPEKATLAGPCRVVPQEYPGLACRLVDLPSGHGGEDFVPRLLAELGSRSTRTALVALRGRHRFVPDFEAVRLAAPDPGETRLRRRGVVVVTGGLGGIGLTLAGLLAERFEARLVLVGRSAFPAREAWSAWVAEHGPEDPTSRKIRRLEGFEAAGAEVLVLSGDVTRRRDMEAVRAAAIERFGAIHGIVHAAGQAPGGLIQLKDRETAAAVLAPKVVGTRILDEVFGTSPLDVFQLCSSLTAVTGALGLVDHVAANAFLDAYAQASTGAGGARIVSVGWDSWLEVGQAAEAGVAGRLGALLDPAGGTSGAAAPPYPRWESSLAEEGERIFQSLLSPDHWVLAEHRLEGVGLLPGTAVLGLMRRSVAETAGGGRAILRDVVFSEPCRVGEGEERTLRLRLRGEDGKHEVTVESAGADSAWIQHARARVEVAPEAAAADHDFATVAERLPRREVRAEEDREAAFVQFGPRWTGLLRELRHDEDEGWARLELPEDFHGDLDDFALHPATTDVVTGIARVLGEDAYLPMGYDELTVNDRLPASVQCHFRLREGTSGESGTLVCDVTVGDEAGRVLLEVRGYTLRRLGEAALPSTSSAGAPAARAGRPAPASSREAAFGLLPREGAEVFHRLLATSLDEPHVLVSVHDLAAVRAEVDRLEGEHAAEHIALLGGGGISGGVHAPYEAPRNELESTLARLYQDMLGVERVGIHDNFFDLGGNSLVATQLITRVREEFEVEIVLRALFESPTVAELARVVVGEQAAQVDEDELSEALAELAGLSREELEQRLAEEVGGGR